MIEHIKELFRSENSFQEIEIKESVHELYPTIKDKYIYEALSTIIENKIIIKDKFNRPGLLQDIDDIYIFQPSELEDKTLPIYYRDLPNYKKPTHIYEDIVPSHKGLKIPIGERKGAISSNEDDRIVKQICERLDTLYLGIINSDS